jgi:sensor domain CHASE-containing protein
VKLTRRGEMVLAVVLIAAFWLVLYAALWVGQEWEADRLDSQEAHSWSGPTKQ